MSEWLNWVKRDKDKGEDDDVAEDLRGEGKENKSKRVWGGGGGQQNYSAAFYMIELISVK